MRIISGSAKGKQIKLPIDKKTRPLKDMVKESLFNILNHSNLLDQNLRQCVVLDLFSGVGSFGIEAISRGVQKVVFYEEYDEAFTLLLQNLDSLNFIEKADIKKKDVYKKNSFTNLQYKFDLVFIDPPFKDKNINLILDNLSESNILSSKTLIILHRKRSSNDKFVKYFNQVREEIYGSSKIIFGFIKF
tara:strand:- start:319 stop:885 length:567 start_codon:yes stop_codon:yes gene_type:complete